MSDLPRPPAPPRSPTDRLIRFCLENKLVVVLLLAFFVLWGVRTAPFDWKTGRLPRDPVPTDAIPDIGENQQIVFAEWMGRSPQDVEDQVTYPLTTALMGIPGVKTVRSLSMFGFSSIYIIFDEKTDFYWSRSRVLEKLNSLPEGVLPEGVQPALGPDATALGQVFLYTLEGRDPDGKPIGGWDLHELRTVQDWTVRYALLSAEGVSEVASVGGYVQEYQIDVDPDAMRAWGVSLEDVFMAVKDSNLDVGAREIEVNRVEYLIRGRGFVRQVADIEDTVVRVVDNVPVYVKNIAKVSLGPALRLGALDKDGAEAVGGVVVVRTGFNPLEAIGNVKKKIAELAPGLPTKAVIDHSRASREEVAEFARAHGFSAYDGPRLHHAAWVKWLRATPRDRWPEWATTSQIAIVPFYDRTGLIYETLGTLNTALIQEVLITVIVVIVGVVHLRSSALISAALPIAVLAAFIAMRLFRVDANIVSLSGIAIAIGTVVDMSIIVCENVLRHLAEAPEGESRLEVVYRACSEVGGAVLTAVLTTIVGFMPVFAMTGAEGKLFRPLAFTKTFALIGSIVVALTIVPAGAHLLFTARVRAGLLRRLLLGGVVIAGLAVGLWLRFWWPAGVIMFFGAWYLVADLLPRRLAKAGPLLGNAAVVAMVGVLLARDWEPLGPERGPTRNLVFVGGLIGGLMLLFYLFRLAYVPILRALLAAKLPFLAAIALLVLFGIGYVWLGPKGLYGPIEAVPEDAFAGPEEAQRAIASGLVEKGARGLTWSAGALAAKPGSLRGMLEGLNLSNPERVFDHWSWSKRMSDRRAAKWQDVRTKPLAERIRWSIAQGWNGLGREFMPPLDEGSYLWMPTTMPHASIGEALDVLSKQGMAFHAIPEVEQAVGKLGRAESALDPAPVSMIETVIHYRPEYAADPSGRRLTFAFDPSGTDDFRDEAGEPLPAPDGQPYVVRGRFLRDERGRLIPDPDGIPFRLWRPALDPQLNPGRAYWRGINSPNDIWDEIVKAGQIPGTTSAPRLQPIAARIVMLQSGMRAPMGVKVFGPDLETVERVALEIERFLKEVPGVEPSAVIADRIVGKPYIEIDVNRPAIARYGMSVARVQEVIEVALGGKRITTTVEGRERFPVRVRYLRELRDQLETLGRILVPAPDGAQVPLAELAEIRYMRGPQMIKSEDTRLVGYVLFDKKPGTAEVDVVEACRRYLEDRRASGEFQLPAGVGYTFAGSYENQLRARATLAVVVPLSLFVIFMILYFQFRSTTTTTLVFSGILVAWAGGFLMIWLYAQPWFLDFSVFGVEMRGLFQVHTINLSVAIWVGFLALFGIASDDGVVIATYMDQSFAERRPQTVAEIRQAVVAAGARRIRPCLMTTATTILALLPVLTATGRGADIMVPMAIPSFGGMTIELLTLFVVPVLYCLGREFRRHTGLGDVATWLLSLATLGLAPLIVCTVMDVRRLFGVAQPFQAARAQAGEPLPRETPPPPAA